MRRGLGLALGAALALAVGGCSGSRPCLVIPMQLRLAQDTVDEIQKQVAAKQADIDRATNSLEMAESRLRQLEEEQAQLDGLAPASPSGTSGRGGR